jgi:hypothetical protein
VKAVTKAGVEIAGVEITPGGSIVISTSAAEPISDLDRELAQFEARQVGTRQ